MGRKRFPVEVSTVTAAPLKEKKAHLSRETRQEYVDAGLTVSSAHQLWSAGVTPDAFWEYTRLLGGNVKTLRLCQLSRNGVTPEMLEEYPSMTDEDLVLLHQTGVSAEDAHHYARLFKSFGIRRNPYDSYFTVVPHLIRLGLSDSSLETAFTALSKKYSSSAAPDVSDMAFVAELKIPGRIIDDCSGFGLRGKVVKTWSTWVSRAQGNATLAFAVAENGGDIDDLEKWLASGFAIDRISNLVASGNPPPETENDVKEMNDLTDEDLAVWAALVKFSDDVSSSSKL